MRLLNSGEEDDPRPVWPPKSVYLPSTHGLFGISAYPRTAWQVIVWWERRRFAYNAFILAVSIISVPLFVFFANDPRLGDTRFLAEPLDLIELFTLANLAYVGGWVLELILRAVFPQSMDKIGPKLLKAGFIMTGFVIATPTVMFGFALLGRISGWN